MSRPSSQLMMDYLVAKMNDLVPPESDPSKGVARVITSDGFIITIGDADAAGLMRTYVDAQEATALTKEGDEILLRLNAKPTLKTYVQDGLG